jgi:hypothetical protein
VRRIVAAWTLLAAVSTARAWGPLGHRIVAESAALLVADDFPSTWGPLIARHRFELGVYSYLPDALFRNIDGAGGRIEAPTHYLNLDLPPGAAGERGSVDLRIVQFVDLASARLAGVHAPVGGYQRGATATGETRMIFDGLWLLGILSHYSGDVSMPYHATIDWNGYARGEGGIHFYFESDCVDAVEPPLDADVLAAARKNRARWLAAWGAPAAAPRDLVRAVLADSLAAVAEVSDLDRRYAVIRLQPPGSSADATRKPAEAACRPMRKLIVDRLARGAVLTSALWESALPKDVDFSGASKVHFSDMSLTGAYPAPR